MKVCAIGDIHGTEKFLECYNDILKIDNDCEKIIVAGDHFDPYESIDYTVMVERYNEFIDCCHKDHRIISLIGNHDIEGYVINGGTNRTARSRTVFNAFSECIKNNLRDSYLVYRIGNYLFSHAGVSQDWLNYNEDYRDELLSNRKGWDEKELDILCAYYDGDWSGYGNHTRQGCTWIRPDALIHSLPEGYNQVVGHTQVNEILNLKDKCYDGSIKNDIWMIDNQRKSKYLVLNIEESE